MPTPLTYPGVYIEEIPSGVRTITGVATSITAFVGRTQRGPVDEPITINSFSDFERMFGGLWAESTLSYAVRDFYLNGGSQAIIVRLYAAQGEENGKSKLKVAGLTLEASYPGGWGMNLRATVDTDVSEEVAIRMGLNPSDITKPNEKLFNLTVRDTSPGGAVERFLNLTVIPDKSRSIDKVLKAESNLVHFREPLTNLPGPILAVYEAQTALANLKKEGQPNQDDIKAAQKVLDNAKKGLDDDITKAEKDLAATKKVSSPVDADITAAQNAVTTAKSGIQASDGAVLAKNNFTPANCESEKKGLYALEKADLFNLLCIPPFAADSDVDPGLVAEAAVYCEKRRAMLIVDPPSSWTDKTKAKNQFTDPNNDYVGTRSKNAAIFFPRLKQPNPLRDNQVETFAPCGVIAGIFARTDAQRGVWKAPAGLDATLIGVPQLSVPLTDAENGELNPLGINCLRSFPVAGRVVWGARTLRGADQLADEYKYIPVRRLALFIEESLYRGTQWVVFEPNDEPLWAQIRLNLGAFMNNLFRQGAFQGRTPQEAYFVKCNSETTTQNDINLGIVNIVVGFAPLKPAEFVVIKIQQIAGQIAA